MSLSFLQIQGGTTSARFSKVMQFVKYQSLGNDCVLSIDRYLKSDESGDLSPEWVAQVCDRHFGIGADGVIVIERSSDDIYPNKLKNRNFDKSKTDSSTCLGIPLMHVYNADGSRAETCFNGLRCVADYLFCTHNFPDSFCVKTAGKEVFCSVIKGKDPSCRTIRTEVGRVSYFGTKEIKTSQGVFLGHVASIGNPHFIIFQKKDPAWVQRYGGEIESHPFFLTKQMLSLCLILSHTHFLCMKEDVVRH